MKNKLLTFLLAFGIAILMWLYVVTVVSPNADNYYNNVPVTVQGEATLRDRNLMITSGELPKISLHLRGNRTDLNKINSSNIAIGVDVSGIDGPGEYNLQLTAPNFLTDVPNSAITVLGKDPATVTVTVDYRASKPVPVVIDYKNDVRDPYTADKENPVLAAETIMVSGPKTVVDQIAAARVEIDLAERIQTFSGHFVYTLCDAAGEPIDARLIVTDMETVGVTVKVVRVKEVALQVTLLAGGGADESNTTYKIEPATIQVAGSDSLLENLEFIDLGTINLADIAEDQVLLMPIKLPEGITNITGVHEAQVDLNIPELQTKELAVGNIQLTNIPEGVTASLITKQLDLKLRGPKNVIDKVQKENITVTVDLSNQQAGTAMVKAQIAVSVPGVGAIGTYNVTVTLKAK